MSGTTGPAPIMRILRSATTAIPTSLENGQLAVSYVPGAGVSFFVGTPSGVVKVGTSDVTTKAYVDATVLTETQRAQAAESALSDAIAQLSSDAAAALSAEAAAIRAEIAAAIADVEAAIASETARAQAAEASLQSAIESEATARAAADTALGADIAAAQAAAQAYADQKISDLVNGAPAALDTLKELADALASSENNAAVELAAAVGDIDARLDAVEALNATQDGRLDAIESKNSEQDGRLTAVEGRATALEGRATEIEADIAALGTMSAQNSNDVNITGGDVSDVTMSGTITFAAGTTIVGLVLDAGEF